MGKLIKNHWARLLVLTAAAYQTLAAIYAFFWPKVFFDFLTTTLDPCVRPIPILQIINLLLGLLALAWEWPLPLFTKASVAARKSYAKNGSPSAAAAAATELGVGNHGGTGDTTKAGMEASVRKQEQQQRSRTKQGDGNEYGNVGKATKFLAGMHSSIEARLMLYPMSCLASFLLYQATNAALYYIVGMIVYFWAFSEGEVVMGVPWTLPRKAHSRGAGTNV